MAWITDESERALRDSVPFPVTPDELAQIHEEAARRWRTERRFRWILILMSPLGFLAVLLGRSVFPLTSALAFAVGWAFLAIALFAFIAVSRPRYSYHLRRVLRRRGFEVCERCGYALAPLSSDVSHCPECGATRIPLSS